MQSSALLGFGFAVLLQAGGAFAQSGFKGQKFPEDDFSLPEPAATGKPLRMWGTWYHIFSARESAGGIPLLDMNGEPISRPIAERDFCRGAIAGTLRITELKGRARTFNFAGLGPDRQVDCEKFITRKKGDWVEKTGRSRFRPAKGAFGDGAAGFALVPLRSIAVDKAVIPFESVLYIPSVRGVEVQTSGGRSIPHDGYFFAADTGGAVKGMQIDVFTGPMSKNPLPGIIASSSRKRFDAYLVDDTEARDYLLSLHQKL